jgi:hypothetical protein
VLEERHKEGRVQAPPADISHLLRSVGVMELRYVRMLSNLCSLTYYPDKVTVSLTLTARLNSGMMPFFLLRLTYDMPWSRPR